MGIYVATAIVLIFYLVLAWFVGTWLKLEGAALWLVRGGLALIGIIGAGLFLWFRRKLSGAAEGAGPGAAVLTEVDALLNRADQTLKSARPTAGASLRTLPVVFVLGEANSAKTATVLHSGLDPELLAGVVYRETEVVPTNTLNLWYARGTVFIEVGGAIVNENRLWQRILQRTSASGFAAAFGRAKAAPRAAVVCCDCERLQTGTEKVTASARRLGGLLQTMANALGASFPVYVLFTKFDQIQKFVDFVSNLTSEETRQILGATVPQRDPRQGVFAEEEKNRLGHEFDQLVYSLAEKRLDYLGRENSPNKLPAVYEFPRELRKAKERVLAFLVELSRPTQLGTNPFLRGFYFSGVRPVMMRENVAAPVQAVATDESAGATRILSIGTLGGGPAARPGVANVVRSRRVPEWTFLPYLFSEVVLRDRAALGTSSQSSKANVVRRVLLAALAVVFFFAAILFLVSFLNNRGVQNDVEAASRGLAASVPGSVDVPTADQLKQLDHLRQTLVGLEANHKDGAPFWYRFGLYNGDRLYPAAKKVYFGYFRRLLLDSTQKTIVTTLKQLPVKVGPNDQYSEPYDALKAHLIMAVRHDQSTREFLAPVLLRIWLTGKGFDAERAELGKKQFEYYSVALLSGDPCPTPQDAYAVGNARNYLKQFNGIEQVYNKLLNSAGKGLPAVNFNQQFPGSSQVVLNSYPVAAAFTADGFKVAQGLLLKPEQFAGGEEWVLGEKVALPMTKEQIQQALRERYYADFANQWRTFLRRTTVLGYGSLKDANTKLQALSGNSSPLLQVFCVAQRHTNVDIPNLANAFQPVQMLEKDCSDQRVITPGTQQYMAALLNLQNSVAPVATKPNLQPEDAGPLLAAATAAKGAVGGIAQGFRIDSEAHIDATVKKLMEDPITYVEILAGKVGPEALNGAGRVFCEQYNTIAGKYPFSQTPIEATAQDVAAVFQPGTGSLWMFYNTNLKNILARQGPQFVMSPSAPLRVSGPFVAFMSHAAAISDTLFPGGAQQPKFTYTLRQLPSKGIDKLNLTIDGDTLAGEGQSKQFAWTGNPASNVKGTYSASSTPFASEQGLWAPFHFVDEARWVPGPAPTLEWPLEVGQSHKPVTLPDGTPVVIRYELSSGAQMFRHESLGVRCPAVGAR